MKAFLISSYGGPEVMRYGDLPDPSPARGELLGADAVIDYTSQDIA